MQSKMRCIVVVYVSLILIVSVKTQESWHGEGILSRLSENEERLTHLLNRFNEISDYLQRITSGEQLLNQPKGVSGPPGLPGPKGPRGPARESKSRLMGIVMEDMGVKSMQKSMHDQNSKLQQLYADAESMKQTNMEEFDEPLHAIEKLIYEIENHISTVKTAVDEYQGDPGDPGMIGFKGSLGLPGFEACCPAAPGPKGIAGLKGQKGESGFNGISGLPGIPGSPGSDGWNGRKGEKGEPVSL